MKITYSYYHFLINVIEQHNFFLLLLLENNCKFYLLNFKYQLWSFFFFETLKTLTKIEKILSYLDIKCSFFQENESKLSKVRKGLVIVKSSFFVILNIIHIIPISATHLKFAKNIEKNCSSTKKCGLHSFKIIDKKKTIKDVAISIKFKCNSKIIFLMVIQKRKILKISNKTTLEKAYFLKKKLSIYTKFFFDNYTNSMQHVVKFLFKWNLIKLKIGKMNSFVYNPIVHFKKAKKFFLHKTLLNSSYEIFLEHILVSGFCFPKKKKTKICKKRVLFYTINNMFRIKNLTFYTNIFLDMSVLNILFNIDRKFFDSNDIDKKCFFCNLQKHKPKIMKKKEKISLKFYFGIFLYKTIKIENLFLSLILEIIYLQKKHLNNILEWIFYIKFNFDITLCCFSNFLLQ